MVSFLLSCLHSSIIIHWPQIFSLRYLHTKQHIYTPGHFRESVDKIHAEKKGIDKLFFWLLYLHFLIFFSKERFKKIKRLIRKYSKMSRCAMTAPYIEVPLHILTSADYPSTPTFPMSLPSLILTLSIISSVDEKLNVYKTKCSRVHMHSCQGILLGQIWYRHKNTLWERSHRCTDLNR